nr:MAG TPA: hypothetical protein [Caudoviricetes sp.]
MAYSILPTFLDYLLNIYQARMINTEDYSL